MESTISKIVVISIGIFLVVGSGIGAWYLLQTSRQPVVSTAADTAQTAVTPTQSQSQTAPSLGASTDNGSAYASLLGQLSAQKVSFVRINEKTTGTAADVYGLYAKDVAITKQLYPDTTDFSIQVAANDLNGDGVPEAIVYEDLQGFCGSGGCTIDIYQDIQDKWVKIFNGLGASDIAVSSKKTGGYADLYLSVSDGVSKRVVRYGWDGTTYRAKETTARWDGTAFIKAR